MGEPPTDITSFTPFQASDAYSLERWPDARYSLVDQGGGLPKGLPLVVSVCPCAGLSMLSTAKSDAATRADRNKWMFMAAEHVLGEARPDVYLGENAPGLFTNMGKHVAVQLIEIARRNGYGVSFMRTDALEHGSPQRRIRTFYFFWKGSNSPVIPPTRSPRQAAAEYLARMPAGAPGADDAPVVDLLADPIYHYLRHKFGDNWRQGGRNDRPYKDTYVLLGKQGLLREFVGWAKENFTGWEKAYSVKAAQLFADGKGCYVYPYVFDRDGAYSAVIKKTAATMIHPSLDRTLNVREVAWMMGLPADYPIPPKSKFNLLCQNVPVESARDATSIAKRWLGGQLQDSGAPVVWFDNKSGVARYGDEAVDSVAMFG